MFHIKFARTRYPALLLIGIVFAAPVLSHAQIKSVLKSDGVIAVSRKGAEAARAAFIPGITRNRIVVTPRQKQEVMGLEAQELGLTGMCPCIDAILCVNESAKVKQYVDEKKLELVEFQGANLLDKIYALPAQVKALADPSDLLSVKAAATKKIMKSTGADEELAPQSKRISEDDKMWNEGVIEPYAKQASVAAEWVHETLLARSWVDKVTAYDIADYLLKEFHPLRSGEKIYDEHMIKDVVDLVDFTLRSYDEVYKSADKLRPKDCKGLLMKSGQKN